LNSLKATWSRSSAKYQRGGSSLVIENVKIQLSLWDLLRSKMLQTFASDKPVPSHHQTDSPFDDASNEPNDNIYKTHSFKWMKEENTDTGNSKPQD